MKNIIKKLIFFTIIGLSVIIAIILHEKQEGQPPYNYFVARVIFSEAAHQCSDYERKLVASVIKNRINHDGFGRLTSLEKVVKQKNAFSCINDSNNKNWGLTLGQHIPHSQDRYIWDQCLKLSTGKFIPIIGESGRPIVYFHDKSIIKPKSWNNKWWIAIKELETDNFIFYSVTKTN